MKFAIKKFAFFLLPIIASLLPTSFALAAGSGTLSAAPSCTTELQYPNVFGYTITGCSSVAQYIAYIFALCISIAGALGLLSIVISAAEKILFAASEGAQRKANERMQNAAIGIGILMLTFIILKTINPDLTVLNDNPIVSVPTGLYWVSPNQNPNPKIPASAYTYTLVNADVPDISAAPQGANGVFYYCPPGSGNDILLYEYKLPNFIAFSSGDGETNFTLNCGNSDLANPQITFISQFRSLRWRNVGPGIYYYTTDDCTGLATYSGNGNSSGQTTSGPIPSFGTGSNGPVLPVNSLKIVNDPSLNWTYGVMFYANNSSPPSGECSTPVTYKMLDDNGCFNITSADWSIQGVQHTPLYAQIFQIAQSGVGDNTGSHYGVSFYSDHLVYGVLGQDIDDSLATGTYYDVPMANFDTDDPAYNYGIDDTIATANGGFGKSIADPSKWHYCFDSTTSNNDSYCIPIDECNPVVGDLKPGYNGPPYPTDPKAYYPNSTWVEHGYNSCLSKIGIQGNYAVIIYKRIADFNSKPAPVTKWAGCSIYTGNTVFYDSTYNQVSSSAGDFATPAGQTIYRVIMFPIAP